MNWKHMGKLLAAGAVLLLGVGWGPMASATANGTQAGTLVSNDATLDFNVAGDAQDQISTADDGGTATFEVDRVLNVNVTEQDGAAVGVPPASEGDVLSFDVTNLSNDDIDLLLGLSRSSADVFTTNGAQTTNPATVQSVCIDVGADGSCDITLTAEGSNSATYRIPSVDQPALGTSMRILVEFDIPSDAENGEFDSWSLVAAVTDPDDNNELAELDTNGRVMLGSAAAPTDTADDPDAVQNVFGDAAGDLGYDFVADVGSATADVANGGQHSDTSQFVIEAAEMTIAKTSRVVWDPVNGGGALITTALDPREGMFPAGAIAENPKRIPGAIVEYIITVSNDIGGVEAESVSVADAAPAATSPVGAGSQFGEAIDEVFVDACDADGTFVDSGQTVTGGFTAAQLGNCDGGQSGTVIFYVEID